MKLHSDYIDADGAMLAMRRAKSAGNVSYDIEFLVFNAQNSRSREFGYEIQLGTYNKTSGPTKSRRFKNSGTSGAGYLYAATYTEHGWFIAELFAMDAEAIFGPYKGVQSFNEQTDNRFASVANQDVI